MSIQRSQRGGHSLSLLAMVFNGASYINRFAIPLAILAAVFIGLAVGRRDSKQALEPPSIAMNAPLDRQWEEGQTFFAQPDYPTAVSCFTDIVRADYSGRETVQARMALNREQVFAMSGFKSG